ncbi:hypothetical protein WEI85_24815 [Actinomycetes bacterium KLBMP 9797]
MTIDIDPQVLDQFAAKAPSIDLEAAGAAFSAVRGHPQTLKLAESNIFFGTVHELQEVLDKFTTDVSCGFEAFTSGVREMFNTYDHTEHRVTQTMRDVTTRPEHS